jgi:hypothetical protein
MKRTFRTIAMAGATAVFLLGASACDNNNQQTDSATTTTTPAAHDDHDHAGHDHSDHGHAAGGHAHGEGTAQAQGVNVPDYSAAFSNEVRAQINDVYKSYETMKNAMVASNPGEAKQAARQVAANAQNINTKALQGEQQSFVNQRITTIRQHADKIAGANDIEAQRGQLNTLSQNLFELVKATDANEKALHYQYCPMAMNDQGAYWISENREIRNPYFGDKMLKCGENREVLEN